MFFKKPLTWTNQSLIVDGTDSVSGAVKTNPNYQLVNTYLTDNANMAWGTASATTYTTLVNQQLVFCNPSANQTINLPSLSALSGAERSYTYENISNFQITFQAQAGDKIRNPYTQVDTGTGGSIKLMYAPGDRLTFFPNASAGAWYVEVERENNSPFAARAVLGANISSLTGSNTVPFNTVSLAGNPIATRYDYSSSFNLSTGNYVVPVPGDYLVTAAFYMDTGTATAVEMNINIAGNNAAFMASNNASFVSLAASVVGKRLSGGNFIGIVYSGAVAGRSILAQDRLNYLQVELIKRHIP